MFSDRIPLYRDLEERFQTKLLVYVTGDRQGMETQIHHEVLDFISDHLDEIGIQEKISLLLYSRGGQTLAGWSIVNLIRQFCKQFDVIIPSKAHSTATLICLGANKIIMTKQATLGPIDPSVNGPLNPQLPGGPPQARTPVSVEAVAGFIDLARNELKIRGADDLLKVFIKLSESVHPLALGSVYRARTQIQMLADRLLSFHMRDKRCKSKIISFICSESGSHDYTISRREARDILCLPVDKPDMETYQIIKAIYNDIRQELELNNAFNPNIVLGNNTQTSYQVKRAIVESICGGSQKFITEGLITKSISPHGISININNTFEGWRNDI